MYYEEKLIDGVLMFRSTPNGDWRQVSIIEMSERLKKAEDALRKILDIEDRYDGGDWDEIEEAREIAKNALS